MTTYDDARIAAELSIPVLVDACAQALTAWGDGRATVTAKSALPGMAPGSFFLTMAAVVPDFALAVSKWASFVPGGRDTVSRSTSIIHASDARTGQPWARIEGMYATSIRTAAAVAAIAQRRSTAPRTVALVGFGQINQAVAAVLSAAVPSIEHLHVITRGGQGQVETAQALRPTITAADITVLPEVDMAVSATGSTTPIADAADMSCSAVVVSLDGVSTWSGSGVVGSLSDHDGEPPSLATAFSADDGRLDAARFIDLNGSAVLDAALCHALKEATT